MDPIIRLHKDFTARVSSGVFFQDIAVIRNSKGMTPSAIADTLKTHVKKSGKKGAAILIDRPLRRVPDADPTGPKYDIIIPASVWVHPTNNFGPGGTEKDIEEIITNLHHYMHGSRLNQLIGQIFCVEEAADPVTVNGDLMVSECLFGTKLKLAAPDRVTTPIIAGSAATVQLSCNTPGAVIYYTTNGEYPSREEETAILYTDTFPVTPGTEVRVAAYAENKQGSDVASAILK